MSVSEPTGTGRPDRLRERRLRDVVALAAATCATVALLATRGTGYAACFALPFLFTWRVVPFLAPRLLRLGVFVLPGGRAIHGRRIPLLGGATILVPLLVSLVASAFLGSGRTAGLAVGCSVLLAIGAYDDVRRARPELKVGGQILAGACLLAAGYRLDTLSVAGLFEWDLGALGPPLLLLWIVVASNALNLTDGLDGLAGSMALLGCVAAFAFGIQPVAAVVAAGGLFGFLRHNFPPARIFMGDAGSLPLGFLLGAFALEAPVAANVPIAVAILGYSLGDLALTVSRRVVRGKPLFAGDRSHVHHKLLDRLGTVRGVLAFVVPMAGAHVAMAIWRPDAVSVAFWAASWATLAGGLVVSGKVRLRRMLRDRTKFRDLHATRRRVAESLRRSRDCGEVESALRALVGDLGLSSVCVADVVVRATGEEPPDAVRVVVPLRSREAVWSRPRAVEERALDLERRTIVCDLLRTASERLSRLSPERGREHLPGDTPLRVVLEEIEMEAGAVRPSSPRTPS